MMDRTDRDLPLFAWTPPACRMLAFPLTRQVGKVRDTARKLAEKQTEKHAEYYRSQVTDGLTKRLARLGVPAEQQSSMIAQFWQAVEIEVARLTYRGSKPGDGAA